MSNYSDYSSGSSHMEATKTKNTMADISHKVTSLSFTYYETCGE